MNTEILLVMLSLLLLLPSMYLYPPPIAMEENVFGMLLTMEEMLFSAGVSGEGLLFIYDTNIAAT